MASLVISIGEGKGTWKEAASVAKSGWDCVYIVTSQFFAGKFNIPGKSEQIIIDDQKPLTEMIQTLKEKLALLEGDIGVHLLSGNGKLHMAILATLIKLPVGIRLVTANHNGVQEI